MSLGRRKFVAHRSLRKVNGELEGFALFAAPLGFTAYSVSTSPATASYGPSSFGGGVNGKDFFVPFVRLDKVSPSTTPDPYSSSAFHHHEHDQDDERESDDDSPMDQKEDSTSSPESDGETTSPPSNKAKTIKRNYDDMSEDGGDDDLDEEKDEDFHRPSSPSYRHHPHGAASSRSSRTQETDENGDMDDDEDDGEDTSVIRCACGNNVDFGLMIQCEMCDVWQHAGCVGIKNQAAIPSHYYCERCKPRPFHCSCGKKEANGKMLQCSVCHLYQHGSCVTNPRDPHVCFRCVTPKSSSSSSSHHASASSASHHHAASASHNHHATKAESSTASSSSSSTSASATMSAAAAAAAARGRRGRKPTPRPQNMTTPSRNSQPTYRQHETRSQTAAASSQEKPDKPDKAEKTEKSEKVSDKQPTPKQPEKNNGAPSTRQQTSQQQQQQQQPRHQSPTRTADKPSTKQAKPRPPTPPPQERTRVQSQKQEQNQQELKEQKQEPEEKEQELKPKKEDKDQKLEEQPPRQATQPKQKGAKAPPPPPVIKEEPPVQRMPTSPTPTTPTTPSTPPTTPPTPPLYTLYDFVSDPSLRKSFETDHAYLVENNYEADSPNTPQIVNDEDGDGEKIELASLSFPERMLLAKYAAEYCKAPPAHRPEILQGVGVLLRVSTAGAKAHMATMAREFANVSLLPPGGRSASQGGWTELTENIYTTPFAAQPPGIPYPYLWHEDKSEGASIEGASSAHGLVVKRAVNTGVLVAEYRGTVVPREVLHKDMLTHGDSLRYLLRPPSPFILLPLSPPIPTPSSSSPSSPMVFGVDARNSGSPARFVRRSCSPNADVRVLWDKEKPRFAIFAKQHIDVHTEVTIPFDFPWRVVQRRVKCACEDKSCEVVKWFDERKDLGVNLQRMLSDNNNAEEDNPDTSPPPPSSSRTRTPSSRTTASAPSSQPTSRTRARTRAAQQTSQPPSPSEPDHSPSPSPSGTPHPAQSSEDEASSAPSGKRRRTSGVKQLESTLNPFTPPVDRPSREQRKLQALVKTFEKLEHREKRKKDDSSVSSSTGTLDRRWKRKKRDHTPVLSPESDERESPSVSSPDEEPTPSSSVTTTIRTTTTTTTTSTTSIKHEEEDTSTTSANGNEWRRRYMRKRPSSPSHSSTSQQPSHPSVSPGTSPPPHPTPDTSSSAPATPTPTTPTITDISTPTDISSTSPPTHSSPPPTTSTSPSSSSTKNSTTQSPPPPHGKKAWLQGFTQQPSSPTPSSPPSTEAINKGTTQESGFDGLIDHSASLPTTPKSTSTITSTSNPP